MTPGERLAAAESALDAADINESDHNFVPLQALIAIGRLLENIDNQQAGS